MTLHDRLRQIVDAMPDSGTVTLPVSELRAWLEEDIDTADSDRNHLADFTCKQLAAELGRTSACIRGWCSAGKLAGAYRLRDREWRIPRASLERFLDAERTRAPKPRRTSQAKPVDLGAWRHSA